MKEKALITHAISVSVLVFILAQAGQSMISVCFYTFTAPDRVREAKAHGAPRQ